MNRQAPNPVTNDPAASPQPTSTDTFWSDGRSDPADRDGSAPRFPDAPAGRSASDPIWLSPAATGLSSRSSATAPRRRAPLVVTGAVLAGTLAVVGGATWIAQRPEPAPVAAPVVAPVRLTRSTTAPAAGAGSVGPSAPIQIEVGTADASATLGVPQHHWTTVSRTSTAPRLMVHVQLSVRTGTLSYDPNLVKLFDARGRLYENALPLGTAGEFGSGRLGAGSTTDGWLAFDVPPGDTTLVLSNWQGESLAAVRIPA